MFGDPGGSHDLWREHSDIIFANRSKTEFRLGRNTQLAHQDDVEWGSEAGRYFAGNWHTTTR
jgi:hypothetical protein